MTITELARFSMRRQQYAQKSVATNLPNGSLPPPGHVNPYCPPGMDITGRTDYKKIIPVSEEAAQKMKDIAWDRMVNNFGMTGTKYELPAYKKAYAQTVPIQDRASAIWTLTQIHRAEATRLRDIVREHNPNWQPGQSFDTSILKGERNAKAGFDVRA